MSSPLAVFGTVAAVGLGVVMLLVDMAIKYNRNSKRRNREHRQQRPSSPVQSERVARTPEDDNSRIVPLNREYHQERPSSPVRIERVAENWRTITRGNYNIMVRDCRVLLFELSHFEESVL
ncbi:uncharacterized protein LOC113388506 [Ctenocephalides felis]|uniref:uncharacterized protein LOC113388506 n=1 Tax=Ctenocephalides felis TaxID=7515 RepID=UPI000E6E3B4B|nr:uncharacterized protein LOC113388506 [Ctenocephalides felis]